MTSKWDPNSSDFVNDPYPTFAELRTSEPVFFWVQGQSWVLTRYEDVNRTLMDPRFSTDQRQWSGYQSNPDDPPEWQEQRERSLFNIPREDHTRIRKVIAPTFRKSAITKLEPLVRDVIEDVLSTATAASRTSLDIVADFAERIPIRVISRILGIPPRLETSFREWAESVLTLTFPILPSDERSAALEKFAPGVSLLREVVADRRKNPCDDLLSHLLLAEEDGERITGEEIIGLVNGLIIAGSETTVHLICYAVYHILTRPEVLALVKDDPATLDNVLEEVLRFDNFGKFGTVRYALEDVAIGDKVIKKGDMVWCAFNSAMRDPTVWSDADQFDPLRDPVKNIGFGRGVHHCPGAHLARLTGRIAISVLLEHYPELTLVAETRVYDRHPLVRRIASLPVRLTAV